MNVKASLQVVCPATMGWKSDRIGGMKTWQKGWWSGRYLDKIIQTGPDRPRLSLLWKAVVQGPVAAGRDRLPGILPNASTGA